MMRYARAIIWPIVLVVLVAASTAPAGVLNTSPFAMSGFTGTQSFSGAVVIWTVNASVDYAVFAPGQFDLEFGAGSDPSAGAHYVYAYQLMNTGSSEPIVEMTVGLDGDEIMGSVGFLAGANVDPSSSTFPGPTSARWEFGPGALPTGLMSDILFFTSAYAPEFDSATVKATASASNPVPSPAIPEPFTVSLLMVGGGVLLRRKRQ
jgi:hypothetical protein